MFDWLHSVQTQLQILVQIYSGFQRNAGNKTFTARFSELLSGGFGPIWLPFQ